MAIAPDAPTELEGTVGSRAHLSLLGCVLMAGVLDAASRPREADSPTALVVAEATAGDLNGDGDALDAVVHVVDEATGITMNLGFAVPLVCDSAFPGFCSPVQPVVGDTIVAFLVSEAAHGATDLNGDGDAFDDVLFLYEAKRGEVRSTGLAVAQGITRSVSFIRFPIVPAVLGDAVLFLVAEAAQGMADLNGDGDTSDAIVFLVTPHSQRIINVGLAAPRIGFFSSPVLVTSDEGRFISVLVGETEQGEDLDRDGDQSGVVTIEVHVQSGKARLPR